VRAEESLQEAEQGFRAIFDSTSDGIFLLDLETRRFAMCNRSCLEMLGYTEEEFLALRITDIHPEADLPFIESQIEAFAKGGKPIRHDIRFKRKDGSIFFADLSPDLIRLDGKRYIVVALKDITKRKGMEEALQSERDQARQYLGVAGVMITALDGDGHVTLINKKGCEILGYRQEEILGRDWFDTCLPQELREEVTGIFNRLMAGDVASVEYHENAVLRKDGQQRIVAFHNSVLRDSSSRIVGVLFSGEDVTARRQAEEALAESERKYRSLVENIPDVTWTTDRQGRTLFISSNVLEVYGYSVEEVCAGGDVWLGNIHPDDRARVEDAFQKLFTTRQRYDVEYRIRRKDRTWMWLHDRSVSTYEKDGQWYADGIFSDINERKRMEDELRQYAEHLEEMVAARTGELQESEARYRSLYHTIVDGIFVVDEKGQIADVNDSVCAQLGYTREELIGIPVSAVSARPDFALDKVFDKLHATGSLSYETEHRRKDGGIVPVELSVASIEYQGRPAVLGVARDITKRRRAEESLQFTQFAVDRMADAAFWMTEDAKLFYVNEAACQALGYSREELLKMTVYDIDPAFTESMWVDSWRKLKAERSIILETVHRARDGHVYPVEIRANYLEFGGHAYDCAFARDIAERKQAEEALRKSEEKFAKAFRSSPIAIAVTRRSDGRIVEINEATLKLLHFDRDEVIGRTTLELSVWVDVADRDDYVGRLSRDGSARDLEYRLRTRDGDIVTIQLSAELLELSGEPCMLATLVDLTQRKQAEEALAESRKKYRGLVEKINDWVWEIDADWVYTYSSPRALELLGYAPEEIVGRTPFDFMPPDEAQRVRNAFQPICLARKPLELLENTLMRKDGSLVAVESSAMPVFTEDGSFLGYTGIDRDVTSRKQAEEALRESEEKFRLLAETSPAAIIIYQGGRFVYANPAAESITGYGPDEFLKMSLLDLIHPDFREMAENQVFLRVHAIERQSRYEVKILTKDGREKWMDNSSASILYKNKPASLVIALDVTERKQAEEALRSLNEQLELQVAQRTEDLRHTVERLRQLTLELSQAEDRERKRIAAILHEDLQQTLAAARFHLNLLAGETCSEEESREIIEQVRQMLREAIDRSRDLSHELSPALYQVELTEILEWLARHMRRTHRLTVHVEAHGRVDSPSEPLKAFLYKVTQELLFNVVKHAGVREARVGVRRMGQNIYLSVVDRGRGFDPRELEEARGFGLLSIRERIRLLGGRMKIRSQPGVGSRILIVVPDQKTAPAPAESDNEQPQP
jgi:PAS domain S-box-containing protein